MTDKTTPEDYGQPAWLKYPLSPNDIAAINQGGCASGVYMPAVTYYDAINTMSEHGETNKQTHTGANKMSIATIIRQSNNGDEQAIVLSVNPFSPDAFAVYQVYEFRKNGRTYLKSESKFAGAGAERSAADMFDTRYRAFATNQR